MATATDYKTVRDPPRGGPLTLQYLTILTPGTYSIKVGPGRLYAILYGGGGGGGGGVSGCFTGGGGGGSGAVVFGYIDLAGETSITLTVGAGGSGGATGSPGGAGDSTKITIGTTDVAVAGGGGGGGAATITANGAGGAGGTYSTASPFVLLQGINGNPGAAGQCPNGPTYAPGYGGNGGKAPDTSIGISDAVKGVLEKLALSVAGGAGGNGAYNTGTDITDGSSGQQPGGGGGGSTTGGSGYAGGAGMAVLILEPR